MKDEKIDAWLRSDGTDRGLIILEILSAWAFCEDAAISDEDADWLDEQIEAGMLRRETLPPEVLQQVLRIFESVQLTEQLMGRL